MCKSVFRQLEFDAGVMSKFVGFLLHPKILEVCQKSEEIGSKFEEFFEEFSNQILEDGEKYPYILRVVFNQVTKILIQKPEMLKLLKPFVIKICL